MRVVPKRDDVLAVRYRQRIEHLIEQSGLSQQAVADKAKLRQPDVNRFLTGQMKYPRLEFLDALARVFSRRVTDLLAETLPPLPATGVLGPDEGELLSSYRALDGPGKAQIRRQTNHWAELTRRAAAEPSPAPSPESGADFRETETRRLGGRASRRK